MIDIPSHNEVAAACREKLNELGKPLVDRAIYNFAKGWNGGRRLLAQYVEKWAQE